MRFNVMDVLYVAGNTAVTIDGIPAGLKNGSVIRNESGREYQVDTVAMVEHKNPTDLRLSTTFMITGGFEGKEVII